MTPRSEMETEYTMMSATLERGTAASMRAGSIVSSAVETVLSWRARARERWELAGLDDRMLHDIGLTGADVDREYRKPFWHI
jgi:uncharacterized protein YjiS (DUF1127 family)